MANSDSRQGGPFVLRLFGTPRIEGPDGVLAGEASQRHRLALLALLVTAPEGLLARDRIQGLLWPETDQAHARRLLNNAAHAIRKALGEDVLRSEADGLRLHAPSLRVDVFEFQSALEAGDAETAAARYKGPFLEGLALPDAAEFDQWADLERDRLARLYYSALEQLAEADAAKGQRTKAVEWWRLRLACTPAESRVVLRLMHALADAGDRASALRVAAAHATLLKDEFAATPDPHVDAFAEELRLAPKAPPVETGVASAVSATVVTRAPIKNELPVPLSNPHQDVSRSHRASARRKARWIGGFVAAGIGSVIFGALVLSTPAESAPQLSWTIIADVDGTADSSYRLTVRALLRDELDRSTVIRTVPNSDIVAALPRAGKSATAPITPELARELAVRHSLRTIVDARLDRVGAVYSLSFRLVDAEAGTALAVANETALNDDALIPAVRRTAGQFRRALGEKRALLGSGRNLQPPATRSFEAFLRYVTAMERFDRNFDRRARMILLHDALSYDSAFTAARLVLAEDYSMIGLRDSALVMVNLARHHAKRASELEREHIDERYAYLFGDRERALKMNGQLVMRRPLNADLHFEQATRLRYLGRFDSALEEYREGARLSPLGPPPLMVMYEAFTLMGLGRHEEAWDVAQRVAAHTATATIGLFVTGLVTGKWAEVEKLAASVSADPELSTTASNFRAGPRAASGRVAEAMDTLRTLETNRQLWVGFSGPSRRQFIPRTRILLSFASHLPIAPPGPLIIADTSLSAQISQGLWAGLTSDTSVTRMAVKRLRALPTTSLIDYGAWQQFLDALIKARTNDWSGILALAPSARVIMGDVTYRFQLDAVLPAVLQWFVAHAYEQTERPDSAAFYYNLIVSPKQGITHGNEHPRTAVFSFAHQRLVVLYSQLGRLEEAKRHWKIFSETFTNPDPELVAFVDEAREALRRAERRAN